MPSPTPSTASTIISQVDCCSSLPLTDASASTLTPTVHSTLSNQRDPVKSYDSSHLSPTHSVKAKVLTMGYKVLYGSVPLPPVPSLTSPPNPSFSHLHHSNHTYLLGIF